MPIVVVAGIVIREGLIMLCQRKPGGSRELNWEFPGGKLEKGESPEDALKRELKEELGVEVNVGRVFDARYESDTGRELLILFYFAEIVSGAPTCIDCNAIEFVSRERLTEFDLAPSDRIVAEKLKEINTGGI